MLRDWWRSLERAPDSLSTPQRLSLIAATVVAAVSRVFALAGTPWDGDELLFMKALEHFDVAQHHPHPPGFPLFVLAARSFQLSGLSDFHALQALNLIAAAGIVPALFFFCRELRVPFPTALSASLLLAFFPNVWFYGGTAFSDVPSMTLIVVANALLLAGCRDAGAYLAGATLFGIAAGFRPQALLIGLAPLVLASFFQVHRSPVRVAIAVCIVLAVPALSYTGAAWLTGWSAYREALEEHRLYILRIDSFRSPIRPPLWRVFDSFFVTPYFAPAINAVITALALISGLVSLLRREHAVVLALAAFLPFAIFSWLMLDPFSAGRFSVGYAPLVAILVAYGLRWIARRPSIEIAVAGLLVLSMIAWTGPALQDARGISPPVAAANWIRGHVDPNKSVIYVDQAMVPCAERYLSRYRLSFLSGAPPPATWRREPGYYLQENVSLDANAENFVRPRGRLWDLTRQRYFEVSVRPVEDIVTFENGWYNEEGSGTEAWRWMGSRSETALPAIHGDARLTLVFYVPLDALPAPPDVTVLLNGAVIDRFRPTSSHIERGMVVRPRDDAANELRIETDRVVIPAAVHRGSDQRTLGLRLNSIGWVRAR